MFFEFRNPLADFGLEESFIRQIELVGRGVDIGFCGEGEFHEGIILLLAEKDADGGFLEGLADVAVKVIDVHLHLPEILVGELVCLEVNQAIALQQAVIEHEVYIEMLFVKSEALLASFEKESLAHLQQEIAHAGDDGILQPGFRVGFLRFEAQELQRDGAFDDIGGFGNGLPLAGEAHDLLLVAAECQALVQAGVHLPLQLAHAPILGGTLNFVEAAGGAILNTDKDEVVRPREDKSLSFYWL